MSKSKVKVLVVGDVGCGSSKFIKKFLRRYPGFSIIQEETHEKYVCEGTDHVIYLSNIHDISIAEESDFLADVDMLLLSHTSDDPETFRSLLETWIPRLKHFKESCVVMDNASTQRDNLTEKQQTSVSEEQAEELEEIFGLVWCTAYSYEYKVAFSVLENILAEKSTHNQSASDEYIPDAFSENQHSSNDCSAVELELSSNKFSTAELSPEEYNEVESIPSDCSTVELSPKKRYTVESIPSDCSTVELSPKKRYTVESIPSDCSTVELSPKKRYTVESIPSDCSTVESIPSDCSTVELCPKDYFTVESSPNKCSTAETNPYECFPFESSPGKCSPFKFSADECSPDHCFPASPDAWSPVKSSPDAAFSSDDFSSDESSRDKLTPSKCPPDEFTLINLDAYPTDESRTG
ncbi:hypothetical protein AVEN_61452-1 [Araneus ventricosus]|uniref:Uncharacterized protein n=1 Tax=Araneus ventricosus TaxID=182803 RepID=A0A4Y2KGK6_ARAVE|nr:hypothetical protein AVEN_61452-1 [Araneus ventricosus]